MKYPASKKLTAMHKLMFNARERTRNVTAELRELKGRPWKGGEQKLEHATRQTLIAFDAVLSAQNEALQQLDLLVELAVKREELRKPKR